MERIKREFERLKSIRHKNVVKFFEKLEIEHHYLFFMEICQGGDLLSYVRRRRFVEEDIAKNFFR